MRALLAFSVIAAVFALSSATFAQSAGQDHDRSVASVENDGGVGEACFGDRYESDADMNEGNTITEEEILRILNPPRS
jgi:hypothetical protein